MKKIMGLDASTTTIGLSLLSFDDKNIILEQKEFYKPPKDGNILERLFAVKKFIINKLDEWKPDEVALEDIIIFMANKSSAQTISLLAILNRTVGLTILEHSGKLPYLYNVNFVRKTIKKLPTDPAPEKDEMPEFVANVLGIKFPYILNKRQKNAVENFDIADSIAVALCYVMIEQKGLDHKQNKIKKKKKRTKKRSSK